MSASGGDRRPLSPTGKSGHNKKVSFGYSSSSFYEANASYRGSISSAGPHHSDDSASGSGGHAAASGQDAKSIASPTGT